ncbi:hypothetical protein JHK82_046542 [Glycine max]|nr:hypothetical protein JHK86_046439 [Glycine max]KAG4932224.1 hypothetical protein JHK87_046226 [Glycine soja]KAG4942341.1 hypothetical protein JHK85_046987 [Glycine max]KAG5096688.1 hypothetical protein JHK82_046542 [Glycine max]KAG5101478.1 hypothetical protein JHK84_046447 [Glycine max]
MCKERLHEIVNEELDSARENLEWKLTMENRFARMDEEVHRRSQSNQTFTCRCELQTPHCNAVVRPEKLVVSNCGVKTPLPTLQASNKTYTTSTNIIVMMA